MAQFETIKTVLVAMIVAAAFAMGSALHRDAPAAPQGVLGAGVYVPADAARQFGGTLPGDRRPGYKKPGYHKPGSYKPGNYRPGSYRPGYNKPGDRRPGFNKPGYRKPGPLHAGAGAK